MLLVVNLKVQPANRIPKPANTVYINNLYYRGHSLSPDCSSHNHTIDDNGAAQKLLMLPVLQVSVLPSSMLKKKKKLLAYSLTYWHHN